VPLNNGETNQQEEKKVAIDTKGNEIVEQENPDTKEESMLSHSLDDDIASLNRLKEDSSCFTCSYDFRRPKERHGYCVSNY
jgi:hypothetical protein